MKKIELTYTEDEATLLAVLGIDRDEVWDYISLDDWDYALVFNGYIPPKKFPYYFEKTLQGCCHNEWTYIKKIDKTVGMAYHS